MITVDCGGGDVDIFTATLSPRDGAIVGAEVPATDLVVSAGGVRDLGITATGSGSSECVLRL